MKKILSLVLLVGLIVTLASPALAAESINENTGKNSVNHAIAGDGDLGAVVNFSYADVDTFSLPIANTGFNMVTGSGKKSVNTIGTGNADAGTKTGNVANTNVAVVDFGYTSSVLKEETLAKNSKTGKKSTNEAWAIDADFGLVFNGNYADVDNFSLAIANTGFNSVTGLGKKSTNSVTTGDAGASTETFTMANTNLSEVSVGDGNGGAEAINEETGKKSNNLAVAVSVDLGAVVNFNYADVDNTSVAVANTGVNSATGLGKKSTASVLTGDASATTKTCTVANTNMNDVNVAGGASAEAKNEDTGKKSVNTTVAVDVNAAVVADLNYADVDNTSVAVANTGVNSALGAGKKSGDTSVSTGDASVTTETGTVANTNISDVNVGGGAGAEAKNEDTGKKSTNTAVGVGVDAAVVVNANGADVDNTSVAVANTGVNSATDVGKKSDSSVTTGNASATTETGTVVNTNVTTINGDGGFPPFLMP